MTPVEIWLACYLVWALTFALVTLYCISLLSVSLCFGPWVCAPLFRGSWFAALRDFAFNVWLSLILKLTGTYS